MALKSELGDPKALTRARRMAHIGVHLLTKAARANLAPTADHSHSSLSWSPGRQMFETLDLPNGYQAALSLAPFALNLTKEKTTVASLPLKGQSLDAAKDRLDEWQTDAGLQPSARTRVPYKMDPEVMAITRFDDFPEAELAHLAGWFTLAQNAISGLAAAQAATDPGASPVRLWPHHFDIASYVALEPGDPETARGIGVGMSAGDGSYGEPYFYVTPWPAPPAEALPDPIAPGHWHSTGFVGSVATGQECLALEDVAAGVSDFLSDSFATSRKLLYGR